MKDKLISKAVSLGYSHYTECTVEELDIMSSQSYAKVIEMTFLQKWLREKHNIMLEVNYSDCEWWQWVIITGDIHISGTNEIDDVDLSYEEVLEVGLKEALNLIE